MLSYMLPVEEKSPTTRNFNLSLNLSSSSSHSDQQPQTQSDVVDETTKLLASERDEGGGSGETNGGGTSRSQQQKLIDSSQREDSFDSDASSKKIKMGKLTTTTKSVALKRWAFEFLCMALVFKFNSILQINNIETRTLNATLKCVNWEFFTQLLVNYSRYRRWC